MATSETAGEQHECPECDRSFGTRQGLGQHHSAAHGEKLREPIICEECGDEYTVKPYRSDSTEYCSVECNSNNQKRQTGPDHPDWEDIPQRACATDYCTQTFPVYPSTEDQEYCSNECQHWGPWRNKDLLIHFHDVLGRSQSEIASEFGCQQTTIGRWLEKHNIESRERYGQPTYPRLASEEWLRSTYVEKDMTSSQIGDWVGTPHSTVWEWCQRHGIETEWPWVVKELHDEEWLVEQYVDQERSTISIATELGCGQQTVADWLYKYDVKLRSPRLPGEDHPLYEGGSVPYGPGWDEAKKEAVRERDGRECQSCGMTEEEHLETYGRKHAVHHIQKARSFDHDDPAKNAMENLVTLCHGKCHKQWEAMSPLRPQAD